MPDDPRTDPPLNGSEADVLRGFLHYHRATLRMKATDLTMAQLDQPLAPSPMTLGGIMKHLAYVEDWWFNQVFAGNAEPEPWASVGWAADPDWDWHCAAQDTPAQLYAQLDESVAVSDRILTDALAGPGGLDALSVKESRRSAGTKFNLRWILTHLTQEYARHNGHADLIRESIDGQVGD